MKITSPTASLEAHLLSSPEATIAVVRGLINDDEYEWTGTSKRFPGDKSTPADKYNPTIGHKLALARALRAAAAQLERQANGLTKNIDDNKKQSQAAAKRPIPKAFRVRAGQTTRTATKRKASRRS